MVFREPEKSARPGSGKVASAYEIVPPGSGVSGFGEGISSPKLQCRGQVRSHDLDSVPTSLLLSHQRNLIFSSRSTA